MISESELDNILVHQKNTILSLLNRPRPDISRAWEQLLTLRELWGNCGYDYKYKEIVKRIQELDGE